MKNRNWFVTILLSLITFGIYWIYWMVVTKIELNERGAKIPTAWLLIIPFVNIWWMWKYYEGAQQVTNEKANAILNFLLGLFISPLIPQALCQVEYNKIEAAPAATPEATPAAAAPTPEVDNTTPTEPPASAQNPAQPTEPEAAPPTEQPPSSDEPKPPIGQ